MAAATLQLQAALQAAEATAAQHQVYGNGLCTCLRLLPCPVRERALLYADVWRNRIDYDTAVVSPTMLLPQVMAR